jgi:hypothetical protein
MPGASRCILALTMAATTAAAQIRLPVIPLPALPVQTLPQTLNQLQPQSLDELSGLRRLAIKRLVRTNRKVVDMDSNGDPIVRNEILGLSPTDAALEGARSLGFVIDREQAVDAMNIRLVVFKAPPKMSTKEALRALRETDPGGSYDYNHIYSGGGTIGGSAGGGAAMRSDTIDDSATSSADQGTGATARDAVPSSPAANEPAGARTRIGLLDTGIDVTHPVFHESAIHAWGCGNRTVPAAHGTAVASLLIGRSGEFRGAQPDAELYAADVYCGSPTGGAVDALVAALGWLVQEKVPVINVSLVGPKNAMLERVVSSLVAGGYTIVAAVGNDGPAAPPLYPASYPNVVGVTAVDAHRHVLVEAARGPQVMFASPGADLAAAGADHGYVAVRGTSFAAPFVAALLANAVAAPDAANAEAARYELAKTAIDLGPPGRDLTYGFGLVGEEYRIDPTPLLRR